ncbi:MAG: inorganic phosphate transporter, partial [Alphaproteobacteria bacterium]|nr:inorganic phosphate transporter [Alphaproteobacteria bacterium]
MPHLPILILCVIAAGLCFDFVNGFHDASNSIATIVSTRVLTPRQAVLLAATFNFIAVFIFGTGVAKTVGSGMISLDYVTPQVILCGLIGAIAWGLITWRFGIPTSSSHALMGGYAGAAVFHAILLHGIGAAADPIIAPGWTMVLAFIVIAPVMGLALGYGLMSALSFAQARAGLSSDNKLYGRIQVFSSAFLSLMHGSNDAQKTAGILAGAMTAAGVFKSFTVPFWILGLSYGVMGLGTLAGGWRIVRTMGHRLTKLKPQDGVCAESAAALSILAATVFNLPISTTHPTTGAILGVGTAKDVSRVRWGTA